MQRETLLPMLLLVASTRVLSTLDPVSVLLSAATGATNSTTVTNETEGSRVPMSTEGILDGNGKSKSVGVSVAGTWAAAAHGTLMAVTFV